MKAKLFEHYSNAVKEKLGLVEDEMHRYFMSLDSSSDIHKMYVLRNYGNSRINILRDQLEKERIGYLTLINW